MGLMENELDGGDSILWRALSQAGALRHQERTWGTVT